MTRRSSALLASAHRGLELAAPELAEDQVPAGRQ
jgi:hypothetical protein